MRPTTRVAIAVGLTLATAASSADALSITASNPSFYTWNGVIHHEPGASTSYFVVNEYSGTQSSTDLGYVQLASTAALFALTADISIDGTEIDELGLDYVVAESAARYDADLVFGGGKGTFEVILDVTIDTVASATDGQTYLGLSGSYLLAPDGSAPPVVVDADGARTYTLEYGVPYRFRTNLHAYGRAPLGHRVERRRSMSASFRLVPEPGSAALVLVGLASGATACFLGGTPERRRHRGDAWG